MRVAVTVLSNRGHKPLFTKCLTDMRVYTTVNGYRCGIEKCELNSAMNISSLPRGREKAIQLAKEQGHTHIMFIDDDMTFPKDTLELLASHNVQFAGANYVHKSAPIKFTIQGMDGKEVDSRGKTGLQEVAQIGFGIALIDLSVFDKIPAPHFEIKWDDRLKDYIGEDYYCCRKLVDNGIRLYVDHDLSQQVGHVGDFVYTLNSYD